MGAFLFWLHRYLKRRGQRSQVQGFARKTVSLSCSSWCDWGIYTHGAALGEGLSKWKENRLALGQVDNLFSTTHKNPSGFGPSRGGG